MTNIITAVINVLLLSLAVEAITEIITSSELMNPLRQRIRRLAYTSPPTDNTNTRAYAWLDKLISCGYCTSVWVALIVCIWFDYAIVRDKYISVVIMAFAIHRISNWIHVLYEIVRKGRISSMELALSLEDNSYGTDRESTAEGATEA